MWIGLYRNPSHLFACGLDCTVWIAILFTHSDLVMLVGGPLCVIVWGRGGGGGRGGGVTRNAVAYFLPDAVYFPHSLWYLHILLPRACLWFVVAGLSSKYRSGRECLSKHTEVRV
jgi:hypothetical protein